MYIYSRQQNNRIHCNKTFKYEFRTHTLQLSNKNTVFIVYDFLLDVSFSNMSTQPVLESFMTICLAQIFKICHFGQFKKFLFFYSNYGHLEFLKVSSLDYSQHIKLQITEPIKSHNWFWLPSWILNWQQNHKFSWGPPKEYSFKVFFRYKMKRFFSGVLACANCADVFTTLINVLYVKIVRFI